MKNSNCRFNNILELRQVSASKTDFEKFRDDSQYKDRVARTHLSTQVPEGRRPENGAEAVSEEHTIKKFSELIKDSNSQM